MRPPRHRQDARTGQENLWQRLAPGPHRGRSGQPASCRNEDCHSVDALSSRTEAEPTARQAGTCGSGNGGAGELGPPARIGGMQEPRGERGYDCDCQRGEFGAVAPGPASQDDDHQVRQRVTRVNDDHGL